MSKKTNQPKFKEHDVVTIKDATGLEKFGVRITMSGTIVSIYEGKSACCLEIQGIEKHPILVDVRFEQLRKDTRR
jgi:hypothetical protein